MVAAIMRSLGDPPEAILQNFAEELPQKIPLRYLKELRGSTDRYEIIDTCEAVNDRYVAGTGHIA